MRNYIIDLAWQKRPKITVSPVVYNGRALLEVYNTGDAATFSAKCRILTSPAQPELCTMYWDSYKDQRINIDAGGKASLLVAERYEVANNHTWYFVKVGANGKQRMGTPLPYSSEILLEVSISSEPSLRKRFERKHFRLKAFETKDIQIIFEPLPSGLRG